MLWNLVLFMLVLQVYLKKKKFFKYVYMYKDKNMKKFKNGG